MVLETIKKLIGIGNEYDAFDTDLTVHINTALDILKQLGANVTGKLTFGGQEDWNDILGDGTDIEMIKIYIYLRCKLVFDPPTNGSVLESIKEQIREYEYRINYEIEYCNSLRSREEVDTTNG